MQRVWATRPAEKLDADRLGQPVRSPGVVIKNEKSSQNVTTSPVRGRQAGGGIAACSAPGDAVTHGDASAYMISPRARGGLYWKVRHSASLRHSDPQPSFTGSASSG